MLITGIDIKKHFNPRSPWGERPKGPAASHFTDTISIHAPRGGSDLDSAIRWGSQEVFQSTLPVGGATS